MTILTTTAKTKLNNYKDKLFVILPNNEMTKDQPPVAKFTDSQWVDEITRRYFVNLIKQGQAVLHRDSLELDEVNLD